jgi:hypothetical protein
VRLYYIDDSGAEKTGYVVYAWIECAADAWSEGEQRWLALRDTLYAKFGIPPWYELHASPFLNGRGNPSVEPAWNRVKRHRYQVFPHILQVVGASPRLRVGSVYRQAGGRRHVYGMGRVAVYQQLVRHLERQLGAAGEYGVAVLDGDGSDTRYASAHRDLPLPGRRLVDAPFFRNSRDALWIQAADLVAYTAYQHLLRTPAKAFMWDWYQTYLAANDVNGGPLEI